MKTKKPLEYYDPLNWRERSEAQEEHETYINSIVHSIGRLTVDIQHQWIIDGLLPENYLAVLAGPPKSGKTAFATALAIAVASGTPFAGRETRQGGVLWIAAEESMVERREILRHSPLADPGIALFTTFEPMMIDTEEGLEMIASIIREFSIQLVIVDPLIASCKSADFDRSWTARRALMKFKRMLNNHFASGIVLHHSKAPGGLGGLRRVAQNDQLAATSSLNWLLSFRNLDVEELDGVESQRLPEARPRLSYVNTQFVPSSEVPEAKMPEPLPPSRPRLVRLESQGRGIFANRSMHFLSKGPLNYVSVEPPEAPSTNRPQFGQQEQAVLDLLKVKALTASDIAERLNLKTGSLANLLTRLRTQGRIAIAGLEDGCRVYRIKTADAEPGDQVQTLHDSMK